MIGDDDFGGEIFYPLIFVDSMETVISVDLMPVIINHWTQPDAIEEKYLKVRPIHLYRV
jgi:hypothetical protein